MNLSFVLRIDRLTPVHNRHLTLCNENLLLLLNVLDEININLERLRRNLWRCQRKPLRQRNVRDTVRLVDFDPDEVLVLGGILNVVA